MDWIEGIRTAILYIEKNITNNLSTEEIAKQVFLSPFYFQKGFAMLCGYTVSEYIRQRRLSLAGDEIASTNIKIIDLALKYGYDSPDSFTKAFTRFHGSTPTAVRKEGAMIKSFTSLKIKFSLEGGYIMDYKIMEKEAFTIIGALKTFKYDTAKAEIPKFWVEHYQTGKGMQICGMYGICIDENTAADEFDYFIADDYSPAKEALEGYVTKIIPKNTWAVFACKGPMPNSLQEVNSKIFSEWLPNNKDYEIAGGYNVELYTNVADYPKGNQDENYYSEIWIPVRKIKN